MDKVVEYVLFMCFVDLGYVFLFFMYVDGKFLC